MGPSIFALSRIIVAIIRNDTFNHLNAPQIPAQTVSGGSPETGHWRGSQLGPDGNLGPIWVIKRIIPNNRDNDTT